MCLEIVRYLILLLFIFSSQTVKSGNGNLRLSKLHYENASGEKGITTFIYDDHGIMYQAKWELLDGSRYSHNYHTFDKSGNMIQKYREFSDGITSNIIYRYDENGYLTSEFFERSDGVTGTTEYIYSKAGKPVKAVCRGLNGWFHGVLIYKVEENGRKTGATINQKGKNVGTIRYAYDEIGNLLEEHWDFSGKWSQTFTYEYEKHHH